MTDPTTAVRSRRGLLLGAVLAGCVGLGALALYGTRFVAGNAPGGGDPGGACAGARAAVARMAPLARGEVAAIAVDGAPKPAPAIAFAGPSGERLSLADRQGRTVLVNLWATWCAPCLQEMPALDRLQATLGGPDFEVVAINLDTRDPGKPRAWLAAKGIRALAYYADPDGRVLPTLQQSHGIVGLPTSLLIDPAGCQTAILKGPADWASEDAARLVRAALGR